MMRRSGFTLLEMLIVVTILAVLSAVAIKSIEPAVDQARYDATARTLNLLDEALLGPDGLRQADGTPLITGFIADIGSTPVLQAGDAGEELRELWDPHSGLATNFPFMIRSGPTGYTDIRLPCGWRGPYLKPGLNQKQILDGWGNTFEMKSNSDNELLTVEWNAVAPFTSPDDIDDGVDVDATLGLVTVCGTITSGAEPPSLATVVLLTPDASESTQYLDVREDEDSDVGSFSFSSVPTGLRAIRAEIDGTTITKYVLVPRTGLNLPLEIP